MEFITLKRLADLINSVEIHIRFDKIKWANTHNEKIDPVAEFINRYVYVQYTKNLKVGTSDLSNLLEMSENSLRKKIKDLEYQGLIHTKTDLTDKRRTLLYPTQAAIWVFEGDTVRRLKTFFDESVRLRMMFEKEAHKIFALRNMEDYPSYKPSLATSEFHRQTAYGYKKSDIFDEWRESNNICAENYPK